MKKGGKGEMLADTDGSTSSGFKSSCLFIFIIFVVLLLSFDTYQRNGMWWDDVILWKDVIRKSPGNARGYNGLGLIYSDRGQLDEAIKEYLSALTLQFNYPNAHNNLGIAYAKQRRLNKAINEFMIALRLNPDYPEVHNNLGITYAKQGRLNEAIHEYMTALKIAPQDAEVHYNLGLAYWEKGLKQKAKEEIDITLKLRPDFTPAQKAFESLYNKSHTF